MASGGTCLEGVGEQGRRAPEIGADKVKCFDL